MTDKLREAAQLAPFDDIRVQAVYKILTDDEMPEDKSEHWEGYQARRIVAALERQDAHAVPQGWKLVPVEPTPEMCNPSGDVGIVAEMAARYRREIWESMLNAAPTPPAQQDAREEPK